MLQANAERSGRNLQKFQNTKAMEDNLSSPLREIVLRQYREVKERARPHQEPARHRAEELIGDKIDRLEHAAPSAPSRIL